MSRFINLRRPVVTVLGTLTAGGLGLTIFSRLAHQNPIRADSNSILHEGRNNKLEDGEQGKPTIKAFGSGPAFLSLPLESAEMVNHNTRLLRFTLPSEDHVSGLPLTCKSSHPYKMPPSCWCSGITNGATQSKRNFAIRLWEFKLVASRLMCYVIW